MYQINYFCICLPQRFLNFSTDWFFTDMKNANELLNKNK